MLRWLAAALVAPALACSTTQTVDTWQAPGLAPGDLAFTHLVVLAVTPDAVQRRIAEDALAKAAARTRVSPGYTIVRDEDRGDVERVRAALTAAGIDGAIVVRLVSADKQDTYVPGHVYSSRGGFYGYYGRVGTTIYEPGYVRTDTYVRIETSLHDVAAGRLLWSAISETLNPSSLDRLMQEVADSAGRELREQGLVP